MRFNERTIRMSANFWLPQDGDAVAAFDQILAAGLERLRGCNSFVLVTGELDNAAIFGVRLESVAGVQHAFPPFFLAEAASLVARLPVDAMDDMRRHVRGEE
jgi:hypothetical protein